MAERDYYVYRYQYREMDKPEWDAIPISEGVDTLPPTVLSEPGILTITARSKGDAIKDAMELLYRPLDRPNTAIRLGELGEVETEKRHPSSRAAVVDAKWRDLFSDSTNFRSLGGYSNEEISAAIPRIKEIRSRNWGNKELADDCYRALDRLKQESNVRELREKANMGSK